MKGLHDGLFSILKGIPNDGTFDQYAAINRCREKVSKSKCSFGYDLSAATDRLPLVLQISLLSSLIGEKAAKLWADVLVYKRPYLYKGDVLQYAVGQPMGALSSWAMLALTHHLIVQYCYKLVYPLKGKI